MIIRHILKDYKFHEQLYQQVYFQNVWRKNSRTSTHLEIQLLIWNSIAPWSIGDIKNRSYLNLRLSVLMRKSKQRFRIQKKFTWKQFKKLDNVNAVLKMNVFGLKSFLGFRSYYYFIEKQFISFRTRLPLGIFPKELIKLYLHFFLIMLFIWSDF